MSGASELTQGWAAHQSGDYSRAESIYREVLRGRPTNPNAWCYLGMVCHDTGRYQEAVKSYEKALRLHPSFPVAYNNMGNSLISLGKLTEAATSCRRALELNPGYSKAYHNLGIAQLQLGQLESAIQNFDVARADQPRDASINFELGAALYRQGRLDEALSFLLEVVAREPDRADAHYLLGAVLSAQGNLDQSLVHCRRALQLEPDHLKAASTILCCVRYDPDADPDEIHREHVRWGQRYADVGAARRHDNDRERDRVLRVGYCSPDLRDHPVATFLEPILTFHDPARVHSVCYAQVPVPDATTARMRALSHSWRSIAGMSDAAVADLMQADGIDILVDLAGHTGESRLRVFAHKPAPVQVTYLGYPGTTGLAGMDYRLVDGVTEPIGEPNRNTEELVRLPHGFCCYATPSGAPAVTALPALERGYVTFGSLHKAIKINRRVLDLWAEVLRSLPDARLLLFRDDLTESVQTQLRHQFERRGVTPDRLEMRRDVVVGIEHLGVYGDIDIALDVFPWSGHTTACDAIYMGVPVVTLLGAHFSGRMTASVLTQIGLSEHIARSPREYHRTVMELASDRHGLERLRSNLRRRMLTSPVCDGRSFTVDLEHAYRRMWHTWCANSPVSAQQSEGP